MRQVHVTVYANVDSDGAVLDFMLCEPGSEPVDPSEAHVFDAEAEVWHGDIDPFIESEIDRRLATALATA